MCQRWCVTMTTGRRTKMVRLCCALVVVNTESRDANCALWLNKQLCFQNDVNTDSMRLNNKSKRLPYGFQKSILRDFDAGFERLKSRLAVAKVLPSAISWVPIRHLGDLSSYFILAGCGRTHVFKHRVGFSKCCFIDVECNNCKFEYQICSEYTLYCNVYGTVWIQNLWTVWAAVVRYVGHCFRHLNNPVSKLLPFRAERLVRSYGSFCIPVRAISRAGLDDRVQYFSTSGHTHRA